MDPETGIIHSRRSSRSSISSVTSTHSASSRDSHDEPHFAGAEVVRDIIVGLSDGLTVPFALAAGLSSLGNARVVVTAGVAEIVAGGISMGLGGYLAGKSEIEHYEAERAREYCEISTMPEKEEQEIVDIFSPYGLDRKAVEPMLSLLKTDPDKWVDFMMKFELSLERPDSSRSWISAITIGLSYVMGGLVPLIPYMATDDTDRAFIVSIVSTLTVLLIFGYVKAVLLGITKPFTSAFQMMLIGACAAATAYGVAKLLPVEKEFLSALDWPRNRND
ncbi:VIT family-domain-containing protein [Zopfochytrium polystomum]|nr:VIT family-domain-containing protein [Zopfochytrium polystomum]